MQKNKEKNASQIEEKNEKEAVKKPDFPIKEEEILAQIKSEYQVALDNCKNRFTEWKTRLKIYNNQRRQKDKVGDSLMFEIHQTVVASLYVDQLESEWVPMSKGDEEVAENLNYLSRYDYRLMNKARVDYDWIWDTVFFGFGVLLLSDFDKEKQCPVPEVIDPMTWLWDPSAETINGSLSGQGKMRFCGREIYMTRNQIDNHKDFFVKSQDIKNTQGPDTTTVFKANKNARLEAQGYDDKVKEEDLVGCNAQIALIEWMTHIDGEIYLVVVADSFNKIVRFRRIGNKFPLIKRDLYPISHTFIGPSIPDYVEDKQRARAKLHNTSLDNVTRGTYNMYFYDQNRVKAGDVAKVEADKFVPVDGTPAGLVAPLDRQGVKSEVQWMLAELSNNAQTATATPDIKQGSVMGTRRSATELSLVNQGVDTRYSLTAKIFGWSEKEFWLLWYNCYKKYFADGIAEKIISIRGSMGSSWRTLSRRNIIATEDPDVDIVSKAVADSKRMMELQAFTNLMVYVSQDPTANKQYGLKRLAKLTGLSSEEVDRLFPKNIDEMEAEEENKGLNENKPQKVTMTQKHDIHLLIHEKAEPTKATKAHMATHRKAMLLAREKPEILPQPQIDPNTGAMINPVQGGPSNMPSTPLSAKQEIDYNAPNTLQTA